LPKALRPLAADIAGQRDRLIAPGFFAATPWNQLAHIPRYLKALDRRAAKYPDDPKRDAQHAQAVAALWERYREREQAVRASGGKEPALDAFRWLIEELKVSLFAQELRTPIPASYKRLEKAWKALSKG
jgi:ATP-dependent RNA helicase HrpA